MDKQVAETILKQLGGNRFKAMTGAKDFLALDKGLQFSIPRASNIRKVRINLTSGDDYLVEFYSVWNGVHRLVSAHGAYADQLQQVFTSVTGLHTRL